MRQEAGRLLEQAGAWIERRAGIVLFLLCCLLLIFCLGRAAGEFFMYDEIIVVRTAMFPHWSDIWNFYAAGRDTIGPASALVVHGALKLPFGPEVSARLPFIAFYFVLLLCTYTFVRRRYPAGYALAALLPLTLPAFAPLAWMAKGYMLEVAGFGVGMACWQRAVADRRRWGSAVGLWLGLAIAIAAQTFAIFLFVPFAAAQLTQDYRSRRVNWPVWLALILFPAGVLPALKGTLIASKLFGANFWAQPNLAMLRGTYTTFLMSQQGIFMAALLVAFGATWWMQRDRSVSLTAPGRTGFTLPEWVFVVMLFLLPCYVMVASYPIHIFREIYVASYMVGASMLLIALIAEGVKRTYRGGALLAVLLLAVYVASAANWIVGGAKLLLRPYGVHARLQQRYAREEFVKRLETSDLPVLTSDHARYATMDYYGSPELKQRACYLTNLGELAKYPASTTDQVGWSHFGKLLAFRTTDISTYLPQHPRFLLLTPTEAPVWLPQYLLGQQKVGHAALTLIGPGFDPPNVYQVDFSSMPAFASDVLPSEGVPGC